MKDFWGSSPISDVEVAVAGTFPLAIEIIALYKLIAI